jgi:pimeloyl-ACP methyl ester carboxylesterase
MTRAEPESSAPIIARSLRYAARDGLSLHVRVTRPTTPHDALPVVALPGLTRNSRDFDALAAILAADPARPRTLYAFDYRGRGLSAWDADWRNYSVPTEADDVLQGLAALNIEKAHFVGTSRGGLILHVLAAMRPGVMASVTLNDVGPEIGGAGLMQIRTALDRMPSPASMDEAARWLAQVHGKAFPLLKDADFLKMADCVFRAGTDGRITPDHDPALLNTLKAINFDEPLPTLWPQFAGLKGHALLVLRGANSSLLTAETLARMQSIAPGMTAVTVASQGHAPMLETGDLPRRLKSHFGKAEA